MSENNGYDDHDLSTLSWCIGEIRESLAASEAALREQLARADGEERSALMAARASLHQAHGALMVVDVAGVSLVSSEAETLLDLVERSQLALDAPLVERIGHAFAALTDYLDALLLGEPAQPLYLFPYYRELLEARGADRIHPADLFAAPVSAQLVPAEAATQQLDAARLAGIRAQFERGLLKVLRDPGDSAAVAQLHEAVDAIGASQVGASHPTFWKVVLAYFEALRSDALALDVYGKRLLARLNLQLRRSIDDGAPVAERLMKDTLFALARARETESASPLVAEVRRAFRLASTVPDDFEVARFGRIDARAITAAREAIARAKLAWEKLVRGSAAELASFAQSVAALRAAVAALPLEGVRSLGDAFAETSRTLALGSATPSEALALEAASALLFAEQIFERALKGDDIDARAAEMAARLLQTAAGTPPEDEMPQWLRTLSHAAQERLTMAAFIGEAQGNLRSAEQALDAFFRDPAQRADLPQTVRQLHQVAGALQLLGHQDASSAASSVADRVQAFAADAADPDGEACEAVAGSLGALGFFVDSLQQPGRSSARFEFDAGSGRFSAALTQARSERPSVVVALEARAQAAPSAPVVQRAPTEPPDTLPSAAQPAAQATAEALVLEHAQRVGELLDSLGRDPRDPSLRDALRPALVRLRDDAQLADDGTLKSRAGEAIAVLDVATEVGSTPDIEALRRVLGDLAGVPSRDAPPAVPEPQRDAAEIDSELLEIFLGEAREVLAAIADAVVRSRLAPADSISLTTIRRGFHTLKGSSRMVGLSEFGEAAWSMEQVLNLWLAEERVATAPLHELIELARARFERWVDALQEGSASLRIDPAPMIAAAVALRDAQPHEAAFAVLALEPAAAAATADAVMADGAAADSVTADSVMAYAALIDEATIDAATIHVAAIDETTTDAVTADIPAAEAAAAPSAADEVRIGEQTVSRPLYEIFLTEADDLIATLSNDSVEWADEPGRPASERAQRAMHSLKGSAALVALHNVQLLAEQLEVFLLRQRACARPMPAQDLDDYAHAIERMQAMLHRFAAGSPPREEPEAHALAHALAARWDPRIVTRDEMHAAVPDSLDTQAALDAPDMPGASDAPDASDALGAQADGTPQAAATAHPVDELDAELLPIFIEEAADYLPQIGENLRRWLEAPADRSLQQTLMRHLHTVKGSARMAGAMDLGQRVHEMETRIEAASVLTVVPGTLIEELIADHDEVVGLFEAIRDPARRAPAVAAGAVPAAAAPANAADSAPATLAAPGIAAAVAAPAVAPADAAYASATPDVAAPGAAGAPIAPDAAEEGVAAQLAAEPTEPVQLAAGQPPAAQPPAAAPRAAAPARAAGAAPSAAALVRVRADLLERVVNESGEVSIARSRLDNELGQLRLSLQDLTENVGRLRSQLREIEIQAESQIQARIAHQRESSVEFDPLEFDRYTRFQELTRMLAESVNDVATVQHNAMRNLDEAAQDMVRHAQVLRELQQNLMRMRMVQFGSISDRLYRVVRQAAKELGKRVSLDVRGASVEIDRGVLERMAGPIEHLLRNAVAHGIEPPQDRLAAGKSEAGEIRVEVRQEGNEVVLAFADDGGGLDYAKILARARSLGLVGEHAQPGERELADLIFAPGFSTASAVTELAGRGVGTDVVRSEVLALGGRIDVESSAGAGTRFTIHLPLTLAIAQVVLVTVGQAQYAIPSSSVEQVLQLKPQALAAAYGEGSVQWQGARVPMHYLGALAGLPESQPVAQHLSPVVIVRSANLRLAMHVDAVSRNQEVVVKNVGPQAARVPGIGGATVLGDGEIVLILNAARLAQSVLGDLWMVERPSPGVQRAALAEVPPTVMVVDDSLTVRKATQRLLAREGYDVMLAKDGVDALRQLQDRRPDVMLVDIEMPRMDGFDLTRNVRGDAQHGDIPIVMITSRMADKHRNYALSLGVDVYLGKPWRDDELLRYIAGFVAARRRAAGAAARIV